MRIRVAAADLLLVATATMWGLNSAVSRYVLTHGVDPRAYAVVRFVFAALLFAGLTLVVEGSTRVARADLPLVLLAGMLLAANQIAFAYALDLATAATVSLVYGATPIFMGIGAHAARIERMSRRFWLSASVSLGGVALIAAGGGRISGRVEGVLVAVGAVLSWSAYSVLAAPLMRRYSAIRLNGVGIAIGCIPLLGIGLSETIHQGWSLSTLTWLGVVYAIVGPMVVATALWFVAVSRVGPSRAGLFANMYPFLGTIFALLLLGERLSGLEIAGGVLIAAAIVLERLRWRARVPVAVGAD